MGGRLVKIRGFQIFLSMKWVWREGGYGNFGMILGTRQTLKSSRHCCHWRFLSQNFQTSPYSSHMRGDAPPPNFWQEFPVNLVQLAKVAVNYKKLSHGARSRFQGPSLAPRDYQDKSFSPGTYGTVLCIYYDTVAWSWAMMEDKLLRFLHLWGSTLSFFPFPSWVACVKLSSFLVSRFVSIHV